jgi:hypothetical protein
MLVGHGLRLEIRPWRLRKEHRIFRPDPIPSLRYMIRRHPLSFAALDIVVVVGEHRLRPMIPNHSIRVQSESTVRRLIRPQGT